MEEKDVLEVLQQMSQEIQGLRELFARRLMNDRQKNELIRTLTGQAEYACIEPFLYDLILLLDRMDGEKDPKVQSFREELMEILERRDVTEIEAGPVFDPKLHKAVKVTESEEADGLRVTGCRQRGYRLGQRVIRPAQVYVEMPAKRKKTEND